MSSGKQRLFLFPVRRRMMAVTAAWLAGLMTAQAGMLPWMITGILCAFLVGIGFFEHTRRRSALFYVMGIFALLGNFAAGSQLALRDLQTEGKAALCGTVFAIENENRVYLRDVSVNGETGPMRAVLVTLMTEEGEQAPEVRVGQRVSGTGRLFAQREIRNPGGVDQRVLALCKGYELSGYILPGFSVEGESVFSLRESFRRAREKLLMRMESVFGEEAPLFQGILLGERGEMDAEMVSAMRLTGIVHVLTVSGLHLSLLASLLEWLLRRTAWSNGACCACQIIVLSAFTCLTGAAAGTVRALIMAGMRMLASLRAKEYDSLTALSVSAFVMTVVRPIWVLSASFQFSFFVVLGILLLRQSLRLSGIPYVGNLLSVCVSAQAAAIPMTLRLYGYLPLLALPMNVLSSLIVPVLMIGGWMSLFVGIAMPSLGGWLGQGMALIAELLAAISMRAAEIEGGIVRLPAPPAVCLLLCIGLMALCSRQIRFGGLRKRAALAAGLLLIAGYVPRLYPGVRYVQLDVGQGDGALICRGRHAVLVDVGPANSYDMLRYLRSEGLYVDGVILSHLDADHAGALRALLMSEIEIGSLMMAVDAEKEETSQAVQDGLSLARMMDVPVLWVEKGDEVTLGGQKFDVLSPDAALSGGNERSLVLYTQVEGLRFLLTGDLPEKCEESGMPDCDVLKVAHHGSKYATSDAFLAQTKPEIALISVGMGNSYGHPSQRVLESLAAVGARTLRTDLSGCITLRLHQGSCKEETYLK